MLKLIETYGNLNAREHILKNISSTIYCNYVEFVVNVLKHIKSWMMTMNLELFKAACTAMLTETRKLRRETEGESDVDIIMATTDCSL